MLRNQKVIPRKWCMKEMKEYNNLILLSEISYLGILLEFSTSCYLQALVNTNIYSFEKLIQEINSTRRISKNENRKA